MNRTRNICYFSALIVSVLSLTNCRSNEKVCLTCDPSPIYIGDNLYIARPWVVEKDSVMYVVRSEIKSCEELPDFSSERVNIYHYDFYEIWRPRIYDQTPEDFLGGWRVVPRQTQQLWNILSRFWDLDYSYYSKSFLSNLKLVSEKDDYKLYEFMNKPIYFIIVLMQDVERVTDGIEGDLAIDVAPCYGTRYYKQYVCPVLEGQ